MITFLSTLYSNYKNIFLDLKRLIHMKRNKSILSAFQQRFKKDKIYANQLKRNLGYCQLKRVAHSKFSNFMANFEKTYALLYPTEINQYKQMQKLNAQQYETTLKYMQTTNQQNFQTAVALLSQYDFNLEHAINHKFHQQRDQPLHRVVPNQQIDMQIVRRYIELVKRKNAEWSPFTAFFGLIKSLLFSTFRLLSRLLPYPIRLKLIGTAFQKLYRFNLPKTFSFKSLQSLLKLTASNSPKCVLLIVSPDLFNADVVNFMNNPELQNILSNSFYLTGCVTSDTELDGINQIEAPMLIALRRNIFEELKQVGRTKDLLKVDNNMLKTWTNESRNLYKRDRNVMIKYRNFLNKIYGNLYEEEEESEININQVEIQREEINEQNRAYLQVVEQAKREQQISNRKKAKEDEERRIKQENEMERKMRKESIPDEPHQGDIVRLSFRCPNGTTIIRNFSFDQKLDMVYQWVYLNDNISFEDESSRNFELMHSFPLVPLSSRRENTLRQIFESSQQKLVIKEL